MKDESSTIDKKLVKKAVDNAVNQVKTFTKKELLQLIKSSKKREVPLIIPVGNLGFIVGDYAIKSHRSYWYLVFMYNIDKELIFSNKQSAIFYAICSTKKNYNLANSILVYDNEVSRLQQEITTYQLRSKKQKANKTAAIALSKVVELQRLLSNKQKLLTKTLKMAKYFYL